MHAFLAMGNGLDESLFRALNLAGMNAAADAAMLLITSLGVEYVLLWLVVPLWLKGMREAAFDFVVVLGVAILITWAIKYAVDRPRPCEVLSGVNLLIEKGCAGRDPAFPSGHTSRAFAFAGFLALRLRWRAGVPAFVFAGLVGFSRIYLGLHWPTDIVGGAIVGIGAAFLIEYIGRHIGRYQRVRQRIVEGIRSIPRRFRRTRPS